MVKTSILEGKIVSYKGQKIIAALFLVTGHLSEHDPLRQKIRSLAVSLVDVSLQERDMLCARIGALLEAALLSRLIQEKNVRIIEAELKYFSSTSFNGEDALTALFPENAPYKGHFLNKRTLDTKREDTHTSSRSVPYKPIVSKNENKGERRSKILSYINERKSVNIKDIATLFPDVSEKTIQRELGSLVADGKVTKRGNKRWSIYLAIAS